MKIYLDKNKRVTGYEITFYDPRGEVPKTHLDTGQEKYVVFLNHKQNKFIQDYLQNGGKVTDLLFNNGFKESKQNLPPQVCGLDLHKTILVDLQTFKPNYEITRHLKDIQKYSFKELQTIPLEQIDMKYLYRSDEAVLKRVHAGTLTRGKNKRYFGLFDNSELVAFVFTINIKSTPQIAVLYHNEKYNDGGYFVLYSLINLLKSDGIEQLDLGGLSREESGINQFKRKWGTEIKSILVK